MRPRAACPPRSRPSWPTRRSSARSPRSPTRSRRPVFRSISDQASHSPGSPSRLSPHAGPRTRRARTARRAGLIEAHRRRTGRCDGAVRGGPRSRRTRRPRRRSRRRPGRAPPRPRPTARAQAHRSPSAVGSPARSPYTDSARALAIEGDRAAAEFTPTSQSGHRRVSRGAASRAGDIRCADVGHTDAAGRAHPAPHRRLVAEQGPPRRGTSSASGSGSSSAPASSPSPGWRPRTTPGPPSRSRSRSAPSSPGWPRSATPSWPRPCRPPGQRLHLHVRDARRGVRLDHRLGPAAGVRPRAGHGVPRAGRATWPSCSGCRRSWFGEDATVNVGAVVIIGLLTVVAVDRHPAVRAADERARAGQGRGRRCWSSSSALFFFNADNLTPFVPPAQAPEGGGSLFSSPVLSGVFGLEPTHVRHRRDAHRRRRRVLRLHRVRGAGQPRRGDPPPGPRPQDRPARRARAVRGALRRRLARADRRWSPTTRSTRARRCPRRSPRSGCPGSAR